MLVMLTIAESVHATQRVHRLYSVHICTFGCTLSKRTIQSIAAAAVAGAAAAHPIHFHAHFTSFMRNTNVLKMVFHR